MSPVVYGVYKGDRFIDVGTATELSIRLGIMRDTIQWLATPSAHKRTEERRLYVFRLDGAET